MSKTLGQVLSYINELLPNKMNSTTITGLLNSEMLKIFRDMTSTALSTTLVTGSSQALYDLPSNCDFSLITENGISVATSAGSTFFNIYNYAGADEVNEALEGYRYYEGINRTFGIYPIPLSSGLTIAIKYQKRPDLFGFASTDSTTIVPLDQDYVELLELRTMAKIAKSGNSPDIELANNFDADALEMRRELKFKRANERMKTPRKRFSYKDW